jgi:hypothetical protein
MPVSSNRASLPTCIELPIGKPPPPPKGMPADTSGSAQASVAQGRATEVSFKFRVLNPKPVVQ